MMYSGTYKIAGHAFRIDSIFSEVQDICKPYACLQIPEFAISTTAGDIDLERQESKRTAISEGRDADADYPDSYLETLAVYRKMCALLLDANILLLHGSCLSIDGNGCLFVASSGTGKSTHTRNWRKVFGSRVVMINDDKPLINVDTMQIYGTPWDGKHHISSNTSAPLRAVAILRRGLVNRIRRVEPAEALSRMMMQTYMPPDNTLRLKSIALLSQLMQKAAFYMLECNMDPGSANTAYSGMPELRC